MGTTKWVLASFAGAVLALQPVAAAAEDISGLITSTRIIREDSRLVGNVTCMVTGAPCITFGAPRISLRLNGFMMTGQGDPNNACSGAITANEQGINSGGQADVEVRGPGVVRNFRSDGVLFHHELSVGNPRNRHLVANYHRCQHLREERSVSRGRCLRRDMNTRVQ